jgi:hypothetical protein
MADFILLTTIGLELITLLIKTKSGSVIRKPSTADSDHISRFNLQRVLDHEDVSLTDMFVHSTECQFVWWNCPNTRFGGLSKIMKNLKAAVLRIKIPSGSFQKPEFRC